MEKKYSKEEVIELLRSKQSELLRAGIARYPKRSDFSEDEVCSIKAFLGPWPRAIEAAGVKTPRSDGIAEKNKEKRIRAKRLRTEMRKEREAAERNASAPDDKSERSSK